MSKKKPKIGSQEHKELKWKESIDALNKLVCTELKPSEIDGVGVFAMRDIKKGEKMYQIGIPNAFDVPYSWFNKLDKEISQALLQFFPFKVTENPEQPINFWYPVNTMQAYINHSDNPNYDPIEDVALRNIKKGEEVTEDYRKIDGYEKVYQWLK